VRVILDPNVYISAVLAPSGTSAHLLLRWRLRHVDLIVSAKLLEELSRTLRRERFRSYLALADVDDLIDQLRRRAVFVPDPAAVDPISRDPDDDYLIALALAAGADALVSGDRDLTDLGDPPVRVLTPRELLDELAAS
jgi:uncharacterized protein